MNYTPDEESFIHAYASQAMNWRHQQARQEAGLRLAKIKADAWDACADQIEIETSAESALTDHLKDTNPYRQEAGL